MSNFISSIAGGSLSEMPPVSNVTPLPTSTSRRPAAPCAAVLEHDEARRLVAAAGHREQAAHLQAADAGLIVDAHAQPAPIGALELARLRGQIARRADVGRQIPQVAQQLRALGYRGAGGQPAPHIGNGCGLDRSHQDPRQCRRARTSRGLQIVDAIQARAGNLRDAAAEVIVVQLARPRALERDRRRGDARARQRGDRGLQRAAPAATVELRPDAQADQHQPTAGQSGYLGQQQRLAARPEKSPRVSSRAHAAAQAAVDASTPRRPFRRARRRR